MRIHTLIAIALLATACGESPTAPTPTPTQSPTPAPPPVPTVPSVAGVWTGRLEMTFRGERGTLSTRAELAQTDRSISGSWNITTAGNDTRGTVTGSIEGTGADAVFTGVATWDTEPGFGTARCKGESPYRGSVTGSTIRLESVGVNWNGTCSDPPERLVWTLTR